MVPIYWFKVIKMTNNPFKGGITYGRPLSDDPGYTYEEYIEQLQSTPLMQSIMRADEALLVYEFKKTNNHITPILKREDGIGYRGPHEKLEQWFSKNFFKLLQERIQYSTQNQEEIENLQNNFIPFKRKIFEITLNNQNCHKNLDLLLKKVLLQQPKETLEKRYELILESVDIAQQRCVPGSALYFLELYSLLNETKTLTYLQNVIKELNPTKAEQLLNFPVLLLEPWQHQTEAYQSWTNNGHKGIIQMATGTGKTIIGIMAIERLAQQKGRKRVIILCHSIAILEQWKMEIVQKLGLQLIQKNIKQDKIIGDTPLRFKNIILHFMTLQSVSRNIEKYANWKSDLIIVDEVHHAVAPEFRKAFEMTSPQTMGLSAYIKKGMQEKILIKELGPSVYELSLDKAIDLGILPRFKWYLHTVFLDIDEKEEFEQLSNQIKKLFQTIKNDYATIQQITNKNITIENLHDFIRIGEEARYKKIDLPEPWIKLHGLLYQRRWIIHRSRPKIEQAVQLASKYAKTKKVILFSMDIQTCEELATQLKEKGCNVFVVHSERKDAHQQLDFFKQVDNGVLIGAKMLDEGIDIPDAEIGINVSSSKTRLQLIQRMGRILRKQKGKKPFFHHFVALPQRNDLVSGEDDITWLDDLAWAQDTALRIGIETEIKEVKEIEQIRKESEKNYIDYLKAKVSGDYGTLRLDNIIKQIPIEVYKLILKALKQSTKEHLTDKAWEKIIRNAFKEHLEEDLTIKIKGLWWILLIGERNPQKILTILQENVDDAYLSQPKTPPIPDESMPLEAQPKQEILHKQPTEEKETEHEYEINEPTNEEPKKIDINIEKTSKEFYKTQQTQAEISQQKTIEESASPIRKIKQPTKETSTQKPELKEMPTTQKTFEPNSAIQSETKDIQKAITTEKEEPQKKEINEKTHLKESNYEPKQTLGTVKETIEEDAHQHLTKLPTESKKFTIVQKEPDQPIPKIELEPKDKPKKKKRRFFSIFMRKKQ